MPNYIYIATSLDGYIATKDGGLDWLSEIPNPDNSDFGFADFMSKIDALIMGRNTFEKVLSFDEWPYDKPVFVLSKTLGNVPNSVRGKAKIIQGDVKAIVITLAERGFKNLYVDGGKVIQSFLREDLIDEMIITRIPVVLGDGIPLFGHLDKQITFTLVKTESLNKELVRCHYIRKKR